MSRAHIQAELIKTESGRIRIDNAKKRSSEGARARDTTDTAPPAKSEPNFAPSAVPPVFNPNV